MSTRTGWGSIQFGRSTIRVILIVFSILLTSLSALLVLPVHAAAPDTGIKLQISPLPIDLTVDPGKSVSTDLKIRNIGPETEQLKVTLRKFKADDQGNVTVLDREPGDTYFDWVTFSRQTFAAPSNQWQTIKMTINVPSTAGFGYYYAAQFERAEAAKPQPGQRAIQGAVASFVLLNVKNPGAKQVAELAQFSADRKVYEFLPSVFTVKVKNTGNVHLVPHGNVYIGRGNSQAGISLPLNPNGGNVLPGSARIFTVPWSDGFPVYTTKIGQDGQPVLDKQGQPLKSLKWDFTQVPKLRIGKYTANLLLVYDDGHRDVPIAASVSFWVIPWRLLAAPLVILALVGFGLGSIGRKLWRLTRRKKA